MNFDEFIQLQKAPPKLSLIDTAPSIERIQRIFETIDISLEKTCPVLLILPQKIENKDVAIFSQPVPPIFWLSYFER
jgi:hypothetical protein